jgi:hypothetical protein
VSGDEDILDPLLDIEAWRAFTREELLAFVGGITAKKGKKAKKQKAKKKSGKKQKGLTAVLGVRTHLRPVDVYCYLRARFGPPNGIQSMLASDSGSMIHWDYHIKTRAGDLYVVGFTREVHILSPAPLDDEGWRKVLLAIKSDFARVGKEKSAALKTLEKWVIFPNKYLQLANLCADLHAQIDDLVAGYAPFAPSSDIQAHTKELEKLAKRASALYGDCVQLALLTPIVAEAFLNMLVLMLIKPDVRDDKEAYEAFVKQAIHQKLLELHDKCIGFARGIDPNGDGFKNFMRIRDKRNDALHGNVEPEADRVDEVYFDSKIPLFKSPGDNIGMFWAMMEKRYAPADVLKDYEDMQLFLHEITLCLEPEVQEAVDIVFSDSYPGFDVGRKKLGKLFPDFVVASYLPGTRYDDELDVAWDT